MRVIAGFLGGRSFESPHGHRTHPMSDKIRGALFGVLGDITALSVLDVFAGSGALAIEAISRGAAFAVAIEVDKGAQAIIVKNLESLGITEQVKAIRSYANAWSTRHQNQVFDLVLVDPPYDSIPWRDMKIVARHVAQTGILVLSWPGKADYPALDGLQMIQQKDYGDAQLVFYRRIP